MTEQAPTPEDVPAPLDADAEPGPAGVEPTQAGVAPTEEALAPKPEDAPPPAAAEPPAPEPQRFAPPPPPAPSTVATNSGPSADASERPEIPIAGAFVGGLVLALILKRLAR